MEEPIEVEDESPDGMTYFELDAPAPGPAKIDYDRTVNLVPIFKQLGEEGTDFLKMVGELVVRHKEADWNSSADYRKRCARQVELFAGILPPRPEGHENIAQIHLPIIGQAVLLLHATLHGQLFPPGGQLCAGAPTTPASSERAKRLGLHLNWQISQLVPEYVPAHDRGGMKMLISGNAFSKWYYSPAKKRPCFTMIQSDDLIMPYGAQSVDPNLADVPRITERLRLYRHQLEALQDAGYYDGIDEIYNPLPGEETAGTVTKSAGNGAVSDSSRGPMQDTMDKVQGQTPPTDVDSDDQPRILLEQHRWLKLLGEDRERPVIATVDEATKKVVYLSIREDEDSRDRARFNREQAANDAMHAAAMAQYSADMQQYMATVQAMTTPQIVPGPMGEPIEIPPQMPPDMTPDQMPVPPEEPQPPPAPAPVEMVTVNWYTKYGCIPNPEGIYDYGVGYLLEGANITADTMMSQIVAAMTLSLFPTYLYSRQARMGRGDLKLTLGGGVEVALPPEQMKNAFFQLQFPPPNPNAIKIVEAQERQVQEFVGASEILAGEVGGSNETATTTEIRMGAARQNLAVIGVRYNRSRTAELKNLARINSRTMPANEWFAVTQPLAPTPPGADPVQMEKVARDEYLEDFAITFTCDPNLASRPQQVADAQKALQAAMSIPPGILDMVAQMTAIRLAYVGLLKAMGREDMAQIIEQSPPPMPPPPPGMMPPGPGGPGGPQPPNGPPGKAPNGKPGTPVPGVQRPAAPPMAPGPPNAGPPSRPQ